MGIGVPCQAREMHIAHGFSGDDMPACEDAATRTFASKHGTFQLCEGCVAALGKIIGFTERLIPVAGARPERN